MIISASRRTDIPAYYSEWFFNRIKEGLVLVRNPVNFHQVSEVNLSKNFVDAIVFWTKNPSPMIDRLDELKDYKYYFQFTLNSYGKDIESNISSKKEIIIPSFIKLSEKIGKNKVIWRYDPILLTKKYTMSYHIKYFEVLASKLGGYTDKCTVSFLDYYKKIEKNINLLNISAPDLCQQDELIQRFSQIAQKYNMTIDTCAENLDFEKYGVKHASCIDKQKIEKICGYCLTVNKDKNQRTACQCAESVDIGVYNTCKNDCVYCYANYSKKTAHKNHSLHNPLSSMLCGVVGDGDVVKKRRIN